MAIIIEKSTTTLMEYGDYLDTLADHAQDVVFLNSSAKHASMVMARIFKHSDKEVLILAGNLNGDVSLDKDYIFELMNFLIVRKGKLKILLKEYNPEKPPAIFEFLKNVDRNQFEIKQTYSDFILNDTKETIHFTVGSKRNSPHKAVMYRLEHDTKNYLAKGNFNDPKVASDYYNLFYNVFNDPSAKIIHLN